MNVRRLQMVRLAALGLLTAGLQSPGTARATVPEEPETKPASAITATSATLNGVLNPNVKATTGYEFTYNTNGSCVEGVTTEPGAEAEVEADRVEATLTGLEPNREYTFCLVATHKEAETTEATSGAPLTFETATAEPVIEGESAVSMTPFEETLEAQINPNNQGTIYAFQFSAHATGESLEGTVTTIEGASLLSGFAVQGTSVSTGGLLQPDTTYYYRVRATNATGTRAGKVATFKTSPLAAPLIDSESVSAVTQTDAQLHAVINPDYQATGYQFKLGTDTGYTLGPVLATEGELEPGFGEDEVGVDLHAEGFKALEPNTEYHYEAVAANGTGSTEGLVAAGDQTFLTLPNPPALATGDASSITRDSATISGSVNPGASGSSNAQKEQDDARYYFQYGTTSSYGGEVPFPSGDVGEGEHPVEEQTELSGLEPGTTYHYRIVATNGPVGAPLTSYGEDRTFTTTVTPPTLSGVTVAAITSNSATITATLDPEDLSTYYELALGATKGHLQTEATGNTIITTPLALSIGSLSPSTVYYYKLVATNQNGMSEAEGAFTTGTAPMPAISIIQPLTAPLLADPPIAFPSPSTTGPSTKRKSETKAQKLAKALKACRHRPRKARIGCERQARRKYAPDSKSTKLKRR